MKAEILVVGHPKPEKLSLGANFASTLAEALDEVAKAEHSVVVIPADLAETEALFKFIDNLQQRNPKSVRVLISNNQSAQIIAQIVNRGHVFSILKSFQDPQFESVIQAALEETRLIQQNVQLFQLINEQNERLKKLTIDLEDRVQKRQKFLSNARQRLMTTTERLEALHRALIAVHRATSIGEMERLLNDALLGALGLAWTRILFHSQSSMRDQTVGMAHIYAVFKSDLTHGRELTGQIYFGREINRPFLKDEKSFLQQVTDAVSLAIDRLAKLQLLENLKSQWEATFDAISEPLSLIDENYVIFRTNRAYSAQCGRPPDKIVGQKCYEVLFARKKPCENCQLGRTFRLGRVHTQAGSEFSYEVRSQSIQLERKLFVALYRDITAQQRLERQILESAKLAELGTIGSSIAHEINNPLGGMLSFLQLIKMDLKGNEPYYQDILEMESGTKRCRDIVQNLLVFSRTPTTDQPQLIDLRQVIERSLKITELQTRSKGIAITLDLPPEPARIQGQMNLLSQAICNILQNSVEAISNKAKAQSGFAGEIEIKIAPNPDAIVIEISDNGIGIDKENLPQVMAPLFTTKAAAGNRDTGLGLTVAHQIVSEHSGKLEISSSPGHKTVARISLPRPVF